MLVKNKFYTGANKAVFFRPLIWTLYSFAIAHLFLVKGIKLNIPMAFPAVIGTAISLFLSFRTNSAYQRWWEARKVWGEIINNSRTLARQVKLLGNQEQEPDLRKRIIKRHVAWCWSLAYALRRMGSSREAMPYLSNEEIEDLKTSSNAPNLLLLAQQKDLKELEQKGAIDSFDYRRIDETIKELCDSQGKSERIKHTVFPTQYSLFTIIFINIFLVLLPLGLVEFMGYYTVIAQTAIGFTFGMIMNISHLMQDPFENKANDTPILALSNTIEMNLMEMIGEEVPTKLVAKNGVLM
jgi:putative membrane protein